LFATGVIYTGGKFAAGIVDTGGKFATGIINTSKTGGKILPLLSVTLVASLQPVLLMMGMHLDLRISPRIFGKIRNGP
jgi:hypothetical protein